MDLPWILISVAGLVVILAVFAIYFLKKKGWNRKVDYKNYYNMGIVWFPLGIVFLIVMDSLIGAWFFIMGAIYLGIGLKNKDKWGKPQKVDPKYQRMLAISVGLGIVALVAGILFFEFMLL